MWVRHCLAVGAVLLGVSACGSATDGTGPVTATDSASPRDEPRASGGDGSEPELFSCPVEHRVFTDDPPPIRDRERQDEVVRHVEQATWDGFEVRRVEATHLGVVALVSGDLPAAQDDLADAGVAHVYAWETGAASTGVDADGQVVQVLQWLIEPAVRDVRASVRGLDGYKSLAYWQEAGAVVLQWKAPVPEEVKALDGVRSDGVSVIVHPTRFSQRDVTAASRKVWQAIDDGRVRAQLSSTSGCADGSGLVVGIVPDSLAGRRAALQAQLSDVAGMPVYTIPEERASSLSFSAAPAVPPRREPE